MPVYACNARAKVLFPLPEQPIMMILFMNYSYIFAHLQIALSALLKV